MQIIGENIYRGANLLLPAPTIILQLDLTDSQPVTKARIATAASLLCDALPDASALRDGIAAAGEQAEDLSLAANVARTMAALQRELLYRIRLAISAPHLSPGVAMAICEYRNVAVASVAGRHAVAMWNVAMSARSDAGDEVLKRHQAFRKEADELVGDREMRSLLMESERLDIPYAPLLAGTPVYQLGHGAGQRRFRGIMSSVTAEIAVRIATYKPIANRLLRDHGVPVPEFAVVESEEGAIGTAREIGFPVVVKPTNEDRGKGVRVGIATEDELLQAYNAIRNLGFVQIEKHIEGFDHRFTFLNGRLANVLRIMPPSIVGDGRTPIRELLDAEERTGPGFSVKKVLVDEEVVAHVEARGHSLDTVLPPGETIVLRRWWRNRLDHALHDVTQSAHPENIAVAKLAVDLVGLDLAGVDFISTDVTRPFHETGGAFTEVNPLPAMAGIHRCGVPIYRMVLEAFFPDGKTGRIPTALALGNGESNEYFDAAAALLEGRGHVVGIAAKGSFRVGDMPIRRRETGLASMSATILRDRRTTAALLQASIGMVVSDGLAIDRYDVAVIDAPHDPLGTAATPAKTWQRRMAKRLVTSLARRAVVLNLDDPDASELAAVPGRRRIFWIVPPGRTKGPENLRRGDLALSLEEREGRAVGIVDSGDGRKVAVALPGENPSFQTPTIGPLIALAIAIGLGVRPDGPVPTTA